MNVVANNNTRIINYLILLYALTIPLSLDILRAVVILMMIFWIREGGWKGKFARIRHERLFQALFALIAILILSLLWTEPDNLKIGVSYIGRYWYLLPAVVIYTSLEQNNIDRALSAFLLGMFISEVVSYGIFFGIFHIKGVSVTDPSPFMHHTLYSVFLVLTAGILLNRLLSHDTLGHKIIYALFFVTVTANLFINSGRTGQFLFVLMLFAVIINRYRVNPASIAITAFVLAAVSYLAFTFSPNFHRRMIETYNTTKTINYNTSIGARVGLNIVAKDIFLEHPLLGVGAGDHLTEKSKVIQTDHPEMAYVGKIVHYHNQYAEFLVIAGIFGFLGYLAILVMLARTQITDQDIKVIKIVFVLAFAVASLSDAMFHLNRPLSLFALFVGLILAQARYERISTV